MRYFKKYLHTVIITLIFIELPSICFCSCGILDVEGTETDTANLIAVKKYSLYGGAGYGNNLIYLGSTISQNLPYYSASLTLGLNNGLNISTFASHIDKTYPYLAFYSMSVRYAHTVNSWFDYSAELSGFKTPQSLQERLFSDFVLMNFTAGFDWKLLYTKVTVSDMYSNENSGYLQIRNSHYFQTGTFFKDKSFISFDPNVDLLFGRLIKINSNTGVTKYGNAPPFVQLKKKHNSTGITYSYSYVFGMMDIELSLPVALNFTKFVIEAEPSYIFPAYSNTDYPSPKGFSITISAYLRIL